MVLTLASLARMVIYVGGCAVSFFFAPEIIPFWTQAASRGAPFTERVYGVPQVLRHTAGFICLKRTNQLLNEGGGAGALYLHPFTRPE